MTIADRIQQAAQQAGISPALVSAVVSVESGGNPWAFNPEPRYRYLVNVKTGRPFRKMTDAEVANKTPPKDFPCLKGDPDQEWVGQQASWGLMQIMGAVAREHDFRGPYLTELCDPTLNLSLGCEVLAALLVWAQGNVKLAAGGYNAGRGGAKGPAGQRYAAKVIAAMAADLEHA